MKSNKTLKLLTIFVVVVGAFVVVLNWGAVFGPGDPEFPMDTDDEEGVAKQKNYYEEKQDYDSAEKAEAAAYYADSVAVVEEAYPYDSINY